jgi:Tfp pilus assembly protein PilN
VRAVNLLPRDVVRDGRAVPRKLHLVGAAAVPVLALTFVVFGWSTQHSAVAAKRAQVEALRAQVPAKVAPAKPVVDVTPLVDARTARRTALDVALTKRTAWATTLGDLGRLLPGNVWLSDLTATSPTPADAATTVAAAGSTTAGAGFTINGFTYSPDDVALVLQRLQLLSWLTNVTLVSTGSSLIGDKHVVQFQITATLQVAPEKPQL